MGTPEGFRRAWLSWFACPRCGHRSLFPRLNGRFDSLRRRVVLVYWCASCGGLSERKRQWLAPALAFGLGIPAFVLIYHGLLDGLSMTAVLWVACVLAGMQLVNLAIERLTNEYVVHDEP